MLSYVFTLKIRGKPDRCVQSETLQAAQPSPYTTPTFMTWSKLSLVLLEELP
jgi:hypothetical protein